MCWLFNGSLGPIHASLWVVSTVIRKQLMSMCSSTEDHLNITSAQYCFILANSTALSDLGEINAFVISVCELFQSSSDLPRTCYDVCLMCVIMIILNVHC